MAWSEAAPAWSAWLAWGRFCDGSSISTGKCAAAELWAVQDCCDCQRNPAIECLLERGEQRTRGGAALQEQKDHAAAAGAIGKVAVLFNRGVALDRRAIDGEPPGSAGHLSLKTSAAYRAGAAAVRSQQHARAGFAIAGTLDRYDRG